MNGSFVAARGSRVHRSLSGDGMNNKAPSVAANREANPDLMRMALKLGNWATGRDDGDVVTGFRLVQLGHEDVNTVPFRMNKT